VSLAVLQDRLQKGEIRGLSSTHACCCLTQEAAQEALAAAQRSYAPYSGCPAGLALLAGAGAGRACAGGVLESCAYNPTINPLQAACIVFVAQGSGDFSEVGHPAPSHGMQPALMFWPLGLENTSLMCT
jgi:hypothetical protein